MIVLHIAPINMKKTNGIRFAVLSLIAEQNKNKNHIIGLMNVEGEENIIKEELKGFNYFKFININMLQSPFNKPDVILFHGIYFYRYIKLYKYILRKKIPYIIVPHSGLTEQAQRQKWLKKNVGNWIFFKKFINSARKIQYLTENEAIQSIGYRKNFYVLGNGIDLPIISSSKDKQQLLNFIFLGRYDVKQKGLDVLVDAINKLFKKTDKFSFNFYGSNHEQGEEYLKKKLPNCLNIEVHKPIFGLDKDLVLRSADVFIHTSRFEGHPMSVLEAMAYGLPCVLTDGTNMTDLLEKYNAGWRTELNADIICDLLINLINENDKIKGKGENARLLVEENYLWREISFRSFNEYIKCIN